MQKLTPRHLEQIGFLLGRAYYAYLGLLERELNNSGLQESCPPGIGSLLFELYEHDARSISALGQSLSLSKSTMTGLIRRAEAHGLVTTSSDPKDRRVTVVKLTALAKSIRPKCNQLADRIDTVISSHLTKAQAVALRKSLLLVTQSIGEAMND